MNVLPTLNIEQPQLILENLSAAVLLLNKKYELLYMNPACEELLALSANRHYGECLNHFLPHAKHLIELTQNTLLSGRSCTEREMPLTTPDLSNITVDCTLTLFSDPEENPLIIIEMLPMDRHLRIARDEQLSTQFQATRELLRGLAHEIKNPLGGLRGAAQLLERELASDELKEYTQVIIDEADRLRNLVDRMLISNHPPRMEMVNIHQLVERVCSLVTIEADGINIIRDYDPSLPEFSADGDLLIQAILNIMRNAAQALNGKGNITLRTRPFRQFTIKQQRHKLVICLQIIDDGPGIPPEMQEAIFYPMVSGRPEGTGLGLTIAQTMANQHHGLIECSSTPGNTVFTLLLPLKGQNKEHP